MFLLTKLRGSILTPYTVGSVVAVSGQGGLYYTVLMLPSVVGVDPAAPDVGGAPGLGQGTHRAQHHTVRVTENIQGHLDNKAN